MGEHSDKSHQFRESRSSKRRDAKEVSSQRQKWLEKLVKLPLEILPEWQSDPEFESLLDQLRNSKPSAGRQRLLRYMVRRCEVGIWDEVQDLVDGADAVHLSEVRAEHAVVALRDRLVDGADGLDILYEKFESEDIQTLRNLILTARRKPKSPTAKGARKKLLAKLRTLGISE